MYATPKMHAPPWKSGPFRAALSLSKGPRKRVKGRRASALVVASVFAQDFSELSSATRSTKSQAISSTLQTYTRQPAHVSNQLGFHGHRIAKGRRFQLCKR